MVAYIVIKAYSTVPIQHPLLTYDDPLLLNIKLLESLQVQTCENRSFDSFACILVDIYLHLS